MKYEHITAVILAGGRSSRLHQEKSLLVIEGESLLTRTLELVRGIFLHSLLVTSKAEIRAEFPFCPTVEDEFASCGPLAGIHAALQRALTDSIFVFACDMPRLDPTMIKRQINCYDRLPCDILIPRHSRGLEPLHAIYHRHCLPFIEANLRKGINPVRSFFPYVAVRYYQTRKCDCFFNINTQQDLDRVIG